MKKFARYASTCLLAALAISTAAAENINGIVQAFGKNAPLEGARVLVVENGIQTATNKMGRFFLQGIEPGEYTLHISYIGLGETRKRVSVPAGANPFVEAKLGEDVVELNPLIVNGSKSGKARALNLQRTASNLMTTIAADSFGQFPDENAAEALQRVSGVSIERDQGEGRFVVIRGIDPDLNNISLDGVHLAAPEADARKVALDVIPTELLDQLQVSKTFLPDMDGDAIGGSVNLKTRSPLDEGARIASLKTQLLYNDLVDAASYMFSGTYGDSFGPENKTAFIFSGTYQKREFGSDNIEVDGPWEFKDAEDTEDGSSGFFAPEIEFRQYDVTRERKSASLNFDHQLSEDTRLYLRTTYNYFNDQEFRHRTEIKPDKGDIFNLTDTTATIQDADDADRDLKNRFEEQEILVLSAGGETRLGDWLYDYKISYSKAEENEPNRLDTDFRNGDATSYTYDFSNPYQPIITVTGGSDVFNPANFELDEFVVENNLADEDEFAVKFDAKRFLDFGENPGFVKFGIKYRSKEKSNDANAEIYSNDSSEATLAGRIDPGSRYPFFTGGGSYLQVNPTNIRQLFVSDFSLLEFETEDSRQDSATADYTTNEDILAAYGMAEVAVNKWTYTGGLRVEQTDFSTSGQVLDISEDEESFALATENAGRDYTDVLLSLNAKYDVSDNLALRFSATNTIARPKFSDSSIRSEVNRADDEIETGNPNLDPYEATNFDVSLERYDDRLGLFAVNLFYKDIDSFIFVTELEDVETRGGTFDVTQPLNGDSASILGLELVWKQDLGQYVQALEGFSIDANLTLTDSESTVPGRDDELPFLKQSDEIFNLALAYENETFLFRIAGTYRSEYLDVIEGDPSEDQFVDSHFQLDAKAVYKIDDRSSVFLEAINLNDEPFRAYFGSPSRMRQFEEYSFSAKLGYSWKL